MLAFLAAALAAIAAIAVFLALRYRTRLHLAEQRTAWAERAKSDLMANMSHELRTPLNAVIGFSELMQSEMMGPLGDPAYVEYARAIKESGDRLLRTLNDVLEIASVDVLDDTVAEDIVDAGELLTGVAGVMRGHAEMARLTLAVTTEPTPIVLSADGPRLKRALVNLLTNAVSHTPPGGRVELAAQPDPDGGIRLIVRDTGEGMAQADIPRMLAPFVTGEDVFCRRHQGQGLGLPIAAAIARSHGGRLDIQSTLGAGTTAAICLPAQRVVIDLGAELARMG